MSWLILIPLGILGIFLYVTFRVMRFLWRKGKKFLESLTEEAHPPTGGNTAGGDHHAHHDEKPATEWWVKAAWLGFALAASWATVNAIIVLTFAHNRAEEARKVEMVQRANPLNHFYTFYREEEPGSDKWSPISDLTTLERRDASGTRFSFPATNGTRYTGEHNLGEAQGKFNSYDGGVHKTWLLEISREALSDASVSGRYQYLGPGGSGVQWYRFKMVQGGFFGDLSQEQGRLR